MLARMHTLAALLAVFAATALGSLDLADDMRAGCRMAAILPRAASNLQTFRGALGGVTADAVRSVPAAGWPRRAWLLFLL